MHNYSREWWIEKVAEGMRNDYRVPQPEPKPEPRKMQGPPKPRYPLCFWDQDAPTGTPLCRVCPECQEHYR